MLFRSNKTNYLLSLAILPALGLPLITLLTPITALLVAFQVVPGGPAQIYCDLIVIGQPLNCSTTNEWSILGVNFEIRYDT